MEQNGLAALEFIGLTQQVLHGQTLEHHPGGGFEADLVRQLHQIGFRQDVQFAVGAQRAAAVRDAVTDLEPCNVAAHRLNNACTFRAQAGRQGWRCVEAAAEIGVDEIQADSLVGYAHLIRAGRGGFVINKLEYFGTAVGAELDTLCHLPALLGSFVRSLSNAYA